MALSPGMTDFLIHACFQVVDMAIAARKSSHEEQDDPVLKQLEARRALLDKMLAQMPAGNLPQATTKPGTIRPPVRTAPTPSPFMGTANAAQEVWLATPKGQRAKHLGALTAYGRNASEETEFQRLRKAYLEAGKTPAEVKVMRAQDKADAALDVAEEKELAALADEEAGAESAVAKVAPEAAVPTGPARAPQPVALIRPDVATSTRTPVSMPNTDETIQELRRRLGKELYRYEMDLAGGGRIAGKPCNCLAHKHNVGLEALAEELIPMDPDSTPLYNQVIAWVRQHEAEFEPVEIVKHPPEYYQAMAPEVRSFRSRVLGTESRMAMLTPEEQERVRARARDMIAEKGR